LKEVGQISSDVRQVRIYPQHFRSKHTRRN
jgi:hypothetical protein